MDAKVRRFRKGARLENGGRSGKRRRYSQRLRAEAVTYLRERMKEGASADAVGSDLGVSGWTLIRWSRGMSSEASSNLRPVEVVPDGTETVTSSKVTLVTPDGYRVEGLEPGDVGRMLEALR